MNIALITYEFYPDHGGVAQHLTSLCKNFKKFPHNLYIFNSSFNNENIFSVLDKKNYNLKDLFLFFEKPSLIYYLLLSMIKIICQRRVSLSDKLKMIMYIFTSPNLLIKTIKNISVLSKFFKKLRIDLVFAGSTFANVLPISYIIAKIFNKKIVALTHGNDFLTRPPFYFKTSFFKNLDKLIVTSERNKYYVQKIHHLSENQIEVIHLGLILKEYEIKESKEELRQELTVPKNHFIILSVGRHVPRKNFDLVIKAINQLLKQDPSMKLKYYLIGSGETTESLKKLTRQLHLENHIVFLGRCNELTRNKYYKLSDVFIMPSITKKKSVEGFGIVFLEANFYKLPAIGTFSGGISEAIVNEKTGLLIKPNNLQDLTKKIKYLYNNPYLRKKMGENGYKRVLEEFNWDKIKFDYINLFNRVLEKS
ncbi:MAG: glycosyltransferase family 4 protein [Candidatus Helarchaeota archaeon]